VDKLKSWKAELAELLRKHGRISAEGTRVISTATLEKRSDVLFQAFRDLHELGYKLPSVRSFRGKHLRTLCELWKERQISPAEFQNRFSIFKTFCHWIHKHGLVEQIKRDYRQEARRTVVARTDRSWSARGIDARAKIAEIATRYPRIAAALSLQREFGLRVRESLMIRPHLADRGTYLEVNRGTKGGRDRVVKIETPEQRAALDRAKALTGELESLGGGEVRGKTYRQVVWEYYRVLRKEGITRASGITSHGLRHEYANEQFEKWAGIPSPVRGGDPRELPRDRLERARLEVAEDLGHSRGSITKAYTG